MKCMQCGTGMSTKRENVPYEDLPGTVLMGVSVSRCARCGEHEIAIPAIDGLNRALAQEVIRKTGRLNGAEIRFLRSYLGYSGVDFARLIHSDPATVSRWESDKQQLGHHTDLLLRAMVALDKQVESYPISMFAEFKGDKASRSRYAFRHTAAKWRPAPTA
jgi:putative zinc finger/helix-turn-helix YgiT family protein